MEGVLLDYLEDWKMQRVVKSSIKTAKYGCNNGACEYQSEQVYSDCSDNDPSNNMFVKGSVTYLGENYDDECEENGLSVRQYYCVEDNIRSSVKRCPDGAQCNSGACIK